MTRELFDYIVEIFRLVYSGRTESARTFLVNLNDVDAKDTAMLVRIFAQIVQDEIG